MTKPKKARLSGELFYKIPFPQGFSYPEIKFKAKRGTALA